MKRDMDLVRKILFAMEENEKRNEFTEDSPVKVDGYKGEVVAYHLKIMGQAGLLNVDFLEQPRYPGRYGEDMPRQYVAYYSISWDRHEFLDAARDNKRWEKAKVAMGQVGGFALDVMKQLLVQYLKQELRLP